MSVLSLIPEDKRKDFDSSRKESVESVYSSRPSLLQRRKLPRAEMSQGGASRDHFITQRVLSAKTHRVKQLQNQLADAHYHLQELSNENRILRAMQKKHEIALSRYENSTAELPSVLNSHSEEMRVQTAQYKQLKVQHKETSARLKERDLQLQQLRDEHQHLLDLTKDRHLPERSKLQARLATLQDKVTEQAETISRLQRRVSLESKTWRQRAARHRATLADTRKDLDDALHNADKLSAIIEMKEKMSHGVSSRRSPVRVAGPPPATLHQRLSANMRQNNLTEMNGPTMESSRLAKFCSQSRNLSSALSREDDTTDLSSKSSTRSQVPRSHRSASSRTTSHQTRKNSKESDEIIELAKTVQDGMADLSIYDDGIDFKNSRSEDVQKKMETLKQDLLNKIKNNEEPEPRISSGYRRYSSTEESIDEGNEIKEIERPLSRSFRSSNVSFFGDVHVDSTTTTLKVNNHGSGDEELKKVTLERKLSGKSVDSYCKTIIQDIEKSSKVIERHVHDFNTTKFESDKIVEQLETVDKINDFVSHDIDLPSEGLLELNNNLKVLTNEVADSVPVPRKRSIASRRTSVSKIDSNTNLFGDSSLSNQDLLNDLLGKK